MGKPCIPGMKPMPFLGTEGDTLMGKKSIHEDVLYKYKCFEGDRFFAFFLIGFSSFSKHLKCL